MESVYHQLTQWDSELTLNLKLILRMCLIFIFFNSHNKSGSDVQIENTTAVE